MRTNHFIMPIVVIGLLAVLVAAVPAGSGQTGLQTTLKPAPGPYRLVVHHSSRVMLKRFHRGDYFLQCQLKIRFNNERVENAIVTMNGKRMEYKLHAYWIVIENFQLARVGKIRFVIKWTPPGPVPSRRPLTVTAAISPGIMPVVTSPANGSTVKLQDSGKLKIKWTNPQMPADFSLYTAQAWSRVFRRQNVAVPRVAVPMSVLAPRTEYETIVSTHRNIALKGPVTPDSAIEYVEQARTRFRTAVPVFRKHLVPKVTSGQRADTRPGI